MGEMEMDREELIGKLRESQAEIDSLRKMVEELKAGHARLEFKLEERTRERSTVNSSDGFRNIPIRTGDGAEIGEGEPLYRSMLTASPDAITITDMSGVVLFTSPKGSETFGYDDLKALNGRNLLEFLHPDYHAKAINGIASMLEGITIGAEEYVGIRSDGSLFDMEVNGEVIKDEDGQPARMIFVTRDITRRKETEKQLKRTEELFRKMVESINDVIYEVSSEGIVTYVSPAIKRILGYEPEELTGKNFFQYMYPDDRPILMNALNKLADANFSHLEYRYFNKDGEVRWVRSSTTPVFEGEKLVGGRGALYDIHERKMAEERLKRSEEKYRDIFENTQDVYYEASLDGILLEISPSIYRISKGQFSREELIGKSFVGFYRDPDERRQFFEELFKHKSVTDFELTFQNKDGSILPIAVSSALRFDQEGNPSGVIGSMRDISERKRAQDSLAASELKYKALFTHSPEGYLIIRDGKFIECNKASEDIIGGDRSLILGLSPEEISPEYQPNGKKSSEYEAEMLRLAYQNGTNSFEWVHTRFDGSEVLVDVNLSVIEYELAQVLLVTWKDITRQRESEIMLRKLSRAVEQSPVSIVITDLNAVVEYVNPAFEVITGYGSQEIIGQKTNLLKSELTDQSVLAEIWKTISSGKEWHGEWLNKRKNGESFWESVTISPISDSSGRITNYLAIKQDVTERKEAEMKIRYLNNNLEQKIEERTSQLAEINETLLKEIEERKKAESEITKARNDAEQANMAKSEFLSRMSHELRTPMNSILGFAQLLEMGELNKGQKKGVGHILRSGRHLLDLINEVLDISRIEAGRLSLSMEPVQLGGIITETMDIIRPQALNQGLTLHLTAAESNKCYVKSDRQRLKQVLLNLVTNAVKYNRDDGSVVISTEIIPGTSSEKEKVRISVSDTGVGISSDDLPKLFTPFERIGAEKSATEGTGLGLAVVKKLVDAMGGVVGVESMIGKGSTFWIEMPMCDSQLENAEKSGVLGEIRPGLEVGTGKVLYIEDNAPNVDLVEQILTTLHSGIHLITSPYGREAFQLAASNRPDLILLDLNLPDIHGSEVLSRLQEGEPTRNIPVVVISADAMPKTVEMLLQKGARKFLTKPLDVMELLKVIDEYVVKKSGY